MVALHHTPTSNNGLCCPKCGIPTRVIDSREWSFGTVRRRRECIGCGYRFWTIEAYAVKRHDLKRYSHRRVLPEPDLAAQHRERFERGHPR